jgi:DNA-binding transcriptional LysR family regulator
MHGDMSVTHDQAQQLDLNLLRPLGRLLETRSVTRAARELGVTQSAASRSLSRLRELFDDPLLVREGQRMHLTKRAEALRPQVARLLADCARLVAQPAEFDPQEARGRVRIVAADYAQVLLLPRLLAHVTEHAPGLDLEALPPTSGLDLLEAGEVDFAIDVAQAYDGPHLMRTNLFDEGFSVVVRRGHPVLGRRLTLQRYVRLEHVLVSPRGKPGGIVDRVLQARGLERRVSVIVPSFGVAPALVAASDRIVTLPTHFAEDCCRRWPLVCLPVPVPVPRFQLTLFWMDRRRTEGLHRWFRKVVREVAQSVAPAEPA